MTRTPTRVGAVLATALLLLLTGCARGGGAKLRPRARPTESRTPIPTPDVCTVAPAAKVFAATGRTVEKIEGSGHVCTYQLSGGIRLFAQYDVGPIASVLSTLEKTLKVNAAPIPGVGRYAYGFTTRTAGVSTAAVLASKTDTGLVANVGMAGPGSAVALAEPVARLMVAAL